MDNNTLEPEVSLNELLQVRRDKLKELQNESNFTEVMFIQEEMKTMPFGDVWNELLSRENVPENYLNEIKVYEKEVLLKR